MRNCVHGDGFCLTCSQLEDARNLIASYEYDKLPALSAQVEALKKERDELVNSYEDQISSRIRQVEDAIRAQTAAESECERMRGALENIKAETAIVQDYMRPAFWTPEKALDLIHVAANAALTPPPSRQEECRRSETGWCWTHDQRCGDDTPPSPAQEER